MNRRDAISRILLLSGGAIVAYSGLNVYWVYKNPEFSLLHSYQNVIDDLTEIIIPATTTPGAASAGVGLFVTKMVREACDIPTQNRFLDGLEKLMDYSRARFGKNFQFCSSQEKIDILSHFQSEGLITSGWLAKAEKKLKGDSFFATLKKYTVIGFCTSHSGATMALAYDPIPGQYQANLKLQPGQRSWATQ